MNKTPSGASAPKKSNTSAAILTIVVCLILAAGAVVISLFSSGSEFEFLPSAVKPGEVHFTDMKYERPDGDALAGSISELINMIENNKSFTEQSRLFTSINTDLANFKTMLSLAEINYYKDTTDDYYKAESDLLNEKYLDIYGKICILLDTIEASSFKVNYERSFLGSGYFNDWQPMTKSQKAIELLKKEQALISDYQDKLSNAFVLYKGEYLYLSSDEFAELSSDAKAEVMALYYEKYNSMLGEIYADLVALRLQIAKEMKTDYVSYAYESFGREYTPEQANAYLDEIAEYVLPLASEIKFESYTGTSVPTMTSFYSLASAASKMGGETEKAFDYMMKYGLFELSASSSKVGLSFELFLEKYNSPFIFVSSTGTANDYLTYAHEFGHFVYDYVNLGAGMTVDSAEIASQAMAYIMPLYSNGVGDIDGNTLLKENLYSTVELYFYACFINKFETAVYSLSDGDELTADRLNEMAYQAALEVGLDENTARALSEAWFEIQHVYIAPMYYVSYAISNDTALQILEAELDNKGEGGVKTFEKFITKDHSLSLYEGIEKEGFESPFDEGRAEKIATLVKRVFGIKTEEAEEKSAA